MNTPATISLMAAAAGVAVGVLALRVSRVRGWRELRWFALIAWLASTYAVANLATTGAWPLELLMPVASLQLAVTVLQHWAWMRYARSFCPGPPSPAGRALERIVVGAAALSLVPGVAFERRILHHAFPAWSVTYNDLSVTPVGFAIMALLPAGATLVIARLLRARRQGVRHLGAQLAAYGSMVVLTANDAVVSTGQFSLPYLLDVGFMLPVGLMAWATSLRFVEAAQDLEALRGRLEALVGARTKVLARTQEALARSERLAALGRLADGVAHQVSNPAAVVTANLRYLVAHPHGDEVQEVAGEAIQAMGRINELTRRLADAGRIASASRTSTAVDLGALTERVVAEARARLPGRVAVEASLPAGLVVQTSPEVLETLVQTLLGIAVEAVPAERPGRIALRAERQRGNVRLTVTDDGVGLRPEELERAFEPFFAARPAAEGSGVGLSVCRGIVEAHGGALWLESAPERGTTAVLVLPEVAAPPAGRGPPPTRPPPARAGTPPAPAAP